MKTQWKVSREVDAASLEKEMNALEDEGFSVHQILPCTLGNPATAVTATFCIVASKGPEDGHEGLGAYLSGAAQSHWK